MSREIHEVVRGGEVHILSEKCSTCIFRPGNLMGLHNGRVKSLVKEAVSIDGHIPCHKTIRRDGVQPAICRGYFDSYRHMLGLLALAERLGMVVYDPPPPL